MFLSKRWQPIVKSLESSGQMFQPLSQLPLKSSCRFQSLTSQARVVICGAGTVANSVAYHLILNGWTDILVLEQDRIGSGTSRFGSGNLGLFKPIADRNLIMYSIKLYKQLQEAGYDIGFKQCGSLSLAQTKDRLIALKRRMAYHKATGLYCEEISNTDLRSYHPYMNTSDLVGAIWVPEDAVVRPGDLCNVLASLAKERGAKYVENCKVFRVLTENGHIQAVETSLGKVNCEYFVNCAGMWARDLGLKCSPAVRVPTMPAEHFYVTTPPLGVDPWTPCVHDYDASTYAREWSTNDSEGGGFMVGAFEPHAKPAFPILADAPNDANIIPEDWRQHLPLDWTHFRIYWERALRRFPILENVQPVLTNSPDTFTPDGRWILGETPEVDNYFVAVGMNGNSVQGAGGIGYALAEMILHRRCTTELLPFNVQRFIDMHNNRKYLQQRTREVVGRHYQILYPHQSEYKEARRLRCSPLYSVLENRGAIFGVRMGYERPLYFDSAYKNGDPLPKMPQGTFYKPRFFDFMKEEYLACREAVGIIDMSSFSKIEIKSNRLEVVEYLEKMCSNNVSNPLGVITQTGMQNQHGGYENDCMLVRLQPNKYFMVSPTIQQTRIFEWMRRQLPNDKSVELKDVTSMYTVINVVGPKSVDLMNELSNTDMNMPPMICKRVNIGYASDVMTMSFTHTGEPGYCLYVPSEYALHVYDRLMTVGHDFGARDVGCMTQRWMRIEKFIPFWGEELNSLVTPYEAGNDYMVRLSKKIPFIGREALERQRSQGVSKRLVMFVLEDIEPEHDVWPWGGEPIYRNDGYVGAVTSAGYGFTLDKLVCLGFIHKPIEEQADNFITTEYILDSSANYHVDIAGRKFLAKPYLQPPVKDNLNVAETTKQQYKPTIVKQRMVIKN